MPRLLLAPAQDVRMPSTDDGIDFEGEFGIITDAVPMGTPASRARAHIRLIVQINDWSLRRLAPIEMKTGFGWVQAKPACSMAPVAVTPDELGPAWRDARVDLPLLVDWNGERFGAANGYAMSAGFDELVAHAAYSRDLVAGTVIGSGTVSNPNYREVGSSCIAERRGIELAETLEREPLGRFALIRRGAGSRAAEYEDEMRAEIARFERFDRDRIVAAGAVDQRGFGLESWPRLGGDRRLVVVDVPFADFRAGGVQFVRPFAGAFWFG